MKFRRGGQATRWPWRQVEWRMFGRCVQITVSRQHPRKPGDVPA